MPHSSGGGSHGGGSHGGSHHSAIHTEAQEEAHATQEAPTFREQEDMYIMIITDLSMSMQIMT
jgi:hypothetical protein